MAQKIDEYEKVTQEEGGVRKGRGSSKTAMVFLLLFAVTATAAAGFFYWKLDTLRDDPQRLAREETRLLVANIGQLIDLPEGEDPTIATVTDPDRLRDQPFFAKAVKGDKVLIYTNARKAILYNPLRHKIVDVAPVNIGASSKAPVDSGQNGTTAAPDNAAEPEVSDEF